MVLTHITTLGVILLFTLVAVSKAQSEAGVLQVASGKRRPPVFPSAFQVSDALH